MLAVAALASDGFRGLLLWRGGAGRKYQYQHPHVSHLVSFRFTSRRCLLLLWLRESFARANYPSIFFQSYV